MKIVDEQKILRTIFKFSSPYKGFPNFIQGNMIRHALSLQLKTSIGVFSNLHPLNSPNNYEDLFLIRKQKVPLKPDRWVRSPRHGEHQDNYYTYWPPAVTFDFIDPPEDILDIIKEKQDQVLQLGGLRNCGLGIISLYDYQWIDLGEISSFLPNEATHITLISSIWAIPRFCHSYRCRYAEIPFWNNGNVSVKRVVAHGQFFRLKEGVNVRKVALKGLLKKTPLGDFGLGEFQIVNWKKSKEANH